MASPSRLANRTYNYAWGHGTHYNANPTDSNVTVSPNYDRGSGFSLRVQGQSGVQSTVSVNSPSLTNQDLRFLRAYYRFITLPSSSRVFWSQSATIGPSVINVRMRSDGKLELRAGTTVLGTSASALATGRWYRVEVAHSTADSLAALKIDGNTEVDWVTTSASSLFNGAVHGAIDTVASAMEFYVTDVAADSQDWCGYGRTQFCRMTSLVRSNTSWNIGGTATDKLDAVDPNPSGSGFNDASYILSANTTAECAYNYSIGSQAKVVWGATTWIRYISNGASAATLQQAQGRYYNGVTSTNWSSSVGQLSTSASRTVQAIANATSFSGWGPTWPVEFYGSNVTGVYAATQGNGAQVSALWVEVDYSDISDEEPVSFVNEMFSFEFGSTTVEVQGTNVSVDAGATVDTGRAKDGSQALKVVHSSGSSTEVVFVSNQYFSAFSSVQNPRIFFLESWVNVQTRQTSGDIGIFFWRDNVTNRGLLVMDANGALKFRFGASNSSATPSNTLPLNTWVHLSLEVVLPTGSASTDCRVKLWVDDILALEVTGTFVTTNIGSTFFHGLGSYLNATGGATVWYDNVIQEYGKRHGKDLKFRVIKPDGAGSLTNASYTAVGVTDKWDAIDDLPNDGDTSYVNMPTGLGTSTNESYNLSAAPGPYHVNYMFMVVLHKRDVAAVSNGSVAVGLRLTRNSKSLTDLTTIAPGAGYGNSRLRFRKMPSAFGKINNASLDDLEVQLGQRSNTIASRVTQVAIVVAYKAINHYATGARRQFTGVG